MSQATELIEQIMAMHAAMPDAPAPCVWILVDPSLSPLGEDDVSAEWLRLSSLNPVHLSVPGYEQDARRCPSWIQADLDTAQGRSLIESTVDTAAEELDPAILRRSGMGRRVAGWVYLAPAYNDTTDAFQPYAHRLTRHLVHTKPAARAGDNPYYNGRRALVRLQDPAVLWAMWPEFSSEQRAQWLGPAQGWWLLKPNGALTSLHTADANTRAAPPRDTGGGLQLTPRQWATVQAMQAFNGALRLWLPSDSQERAQVDIEAAREAGLNAVRLYDAAGGHEVVDQQAVAFHAMAQHPRFDLSPLLRSYLNRKKEEARAQGHPPDMAKWLNALSAADWHRVRAELQSPGGTSTGQAA